MDKNGTMMQYFEWYLPSGMLWNQLKEQTGELAGNGITAVWIPPCYKGSKGLDDEGYAVYDIWDLGEFDQKGTVPTKYGTKQELLDAIRASHEQGIQVYADIVLDHMMGADRQEYVTAQEYNPDNRDQPASGDKQIAAWTHFTFPGRGKKHSDFEWHWYHFTGIDWDAKQKEDGVFLFDGKDWEDQVDQEKGNYDFLMGADLDLNNFEVISELTRWGKWFLEETDVDGFRFDAVKHMKFDFYKRWLDTMRREEKAELFSVGEYWNGDLAALKNYIDTTQGALSLFDVPLHYKFLEAANSGGAFDMRTIFDGTLTQDNPSRAVTFVDNHDTQPGQSLESWVPDWFKPLAYSLILLREAGYPCLFYGDYYGIAHDGVAPKKEMLDALLRARANLAYGKQNDYFDDPNLIGWTREGDDEHEGSGVAVVMTNGGEGQKQMYVGQKFSGRVFVDCLGNRQEEIRIGEDGNGVFPVSGGSVSVWKQKG